MSVPTHLQPYYSIAYARKEAAFRMWVMSGYRDFDAYTRYMRWYRAANAIMQSGIQ